MNRDEHYRAAEDLLKNVVDYENGQVYESWTATVLAALTHAVLASTPAAVIDEIEHQELDRRYGLKKAR
jgi:hypothetical protein